MHKLDDLIFTFANLRTLLRLYASISKESHPLVLNTSQHKARLPARSNTEPQSGSVEDGSFSTRSVGNPSKVSNITLTRSQFRYP